MSDEPSRYKTTLDALERAVQVPADEQTEEQPAAESHGSAWAWDEQRRQAELAGGA